MLVAMLVQAFDFFMRLQMLWVLMALLGFLAPRAITKGKRGVTKFLLVVASIGSVFAAITYAVPAIKTGDVLSFVSCLLLAGWSYRTAALWWQIR